MFDPNREPNHQPSQPQELKENKSVNREVKFSSRTYKGMKYATVLFLILFCLAAIKRLQNGQSVLVPLFLIWQTYKRFNKVDELGRRSLVLEAKQRVLQARNSQAFRNNNGLAYSDRSAGHDSSECGPRR